MQNATEVLRDLPTLKKLYNFVTGIASRGDHMIEGANVPIKKNKDKKKKVTKLLKKIK